MRVLVADSSSLICSRMLGWLQKIPNLKIRTVKEPHRVIQTAGSFLPDFVVMDIMMLDPCGLDILAELKRTHRSLPVMVLTDALEPTYRSCCMNAGADFFFRKSDEFPAAVEVIAKFAEAKIAEHFQMPEKEPQAEKQTEPDCDGGDVAACNGNCKCRMLWSVAQDLIFVKKNNPKGCPYAVDAGALHACICPLRGRC